MYAMQEGVLNTNITSIVLAIFYPFPTAVPLNLISCKLLKNCISFPDLFQFVVHSFYNFMEATYEINVYVLNIVNNTYHLNRIYKVTVMI
jgi:hypothetical protein